MGNRPDKAGISLQSDRQLEFTTLLQCGKMELGEKWRRIKERETEQ
jgi:hypothetical protein